MGHLTHAKESYRKLIEKVNSFPIGMVEDERTYKFMQSLYSTEEANLVAHMPLKFTKAKALAHITGIAESELTERLQKMAQRGIVYCLDRDDQTYYAPMLAIPGFVEMTMMKVRDDIPQKELAVLMTEMMQDSQFAQEVFREDTQFGRALVDSRAAENTSDILPYEVVTDVIKDAKKLAVVHCYCRHKKEHAGHGCKYPVEVCMALNSGAEFIVKQKFGRQIDTKEALDIVAQTSELGLMHIGDNVKNNLGFICNCCECCCCILRSYHDHGVFPVAVTSSYLMRVKDDKCVGCGKCVPRCQLKAITLVPTSGNGNGPQRRKAKIAPEVCVGCGICYRACKVNALYMEKRAKQIMTPENGMEKMFVMAIERGKLQNFLFNDVHSPVQAAARKLLGPILKAKGVRNYLLRSYVRQRLFRMLGKAMQKDNTKFMMEI